MGPRVWIVNPFDNLPHEGNRPQRYWLMAQAFAAAGCAVRLWTSDFSHARKKRRVFIRDAPSPVALTLLPTRPYQKNVCLARALSHRALAATFWREASSLLERDGGETPDVVIASAPPLGLCAAAHDVARRVGAKFICDIQDAWPETFSRLLPRPLKGLTPLVFLPMTLTSRKLYRRADLVTGVSSRYAELSRRDDFFLAYHGIEGGDAAGAGARRTRFTRLVYVGNLGAGYDLETALDALALRRDLHLDIAGSGPKELSLRRHVHALGLEKSVTFHGYLNEEDLTHLLASCDVGLVPMLDESGVGLPYKLTDYLKSHLHVLSSLHGECGEILARTGFGETYVAHDPASLLAALDRLKPASVALPSALRAEEIYRGYVSRILQ